MTADKTDFPDWLNPILVKELRQGLRSGIFVAAWIVIQAMAILALVSEAAAPPAHGASGVASRMGFWGGAAVVLWLLLPMGAVRSVGGEAGESRVELLVLSGSAERRLCYGKWQTMVLQGALVYLSLLPYLVARYFVSQAEPLELIVGSGAMLLGNAVASSIAICASVCKALWLRIWMACLGVVNAIGVLGITGAAAAGAGALLGATGPPALVAAFLGGIFVLSGAACVTSICLAYATDKLRLRRGSYEEGTFSGPAVALFATPFFLAIIGVCTVGFGVPVLAWIIAWSNWSDRRT